MSVVNEETVLYFIDQYVDNRFMSRSEPFYEKEVALDLFDRMQSTASSDVFYRMSVSLPLEEYETLQLATQRIKIKFLERESTEEEPEYVEPTVKAYRYNNGYVLLNNKRSREFIESRSLESLFYTIGRKDLFFIPKETISTLNLGFLEQLKVKNITDKVLNLIN